MSSPERRLARAVEYHRKGRIGEAQRLYGEIVATNPSCHEAWGQLGRLWIQKEHYENAVASLSRAVSIAPTVAEYHLTLGVAHAGSGRLDAAAQSMTQAVALDPRRAESFYKLGVVLQAMGSDFALQTFGQAARLAPKNALFRRSFAAALVRAGHLAAAADEWRHVIELERASVSSLVELATVHRLLGDNRASLEVAKRAVDKHPNSPDALAELGGALCAEGRLDDAEDVLRRALAEDVNHLPALFNLSSALVQLGRADESMDLLRRVLALRPDQHDSRSNLLVIMSWSPNAGDAETLREALEFGARQRAEASQRGGGPKSARSGAHANSRDPRRRLRVGYFSADFSRLLPFLPPLLQHHDRVAFEIVCYSGTSVQPQEVVRLKQHVDGWHEVSGLSHAALAQRIRDDQIDVLVDLTMHMVGSRLRAFAEKPAPVQIAWLAYPGTTGVEAMDYRLTDPHLDPPGGSGLPYTERSLWLPESFWLYAERLSDCEPGPLPAEGRGFVTFGSLNAFTKYHDGLAATWSAVLRAVTDAHLVLQVPAGRSRDRVLRSFQEHGIDAGRIELVSHMPLREYFEAYRRIDVGLDTVPYNGHTTTLDAAWMGVPTVTWVGKKVVGRAGLSIARNLGLPELASDTEAGFIATATQLAGDWPRLKALRETLRERLRASPLMNARQFARNLEQIYRGAFERWCDPGPSAATSNSRPEQPALQVATAARERFAVCVVSPAWYAHAASFHEVAEGLHHALLELGVDSTMTTSLNLDRRTVVLGSNLLPYTGLTPPAGSILFNLEQISPDSPWMTPPMLELFRRYSVWDYSEGNIRRLEQMGLPRPALVPIGYVPQLTRIPKLEDEDIDVLFYGSVNDRRQAVLRALAARGLRVGVVPFGTYGQERDAFIARAKVVVNVHFYGPKVFEIVRVSYLLAKGAPSSRSAGLTRTRSASSRQASRSRATRGSSIGASSSSATRARGRRSPPGGSS